MQRTGQIEEAPAVPEGTRVYAVGDIHGRIDLLRHLHTLIRADAEGAPERRVVVYLGDYVDRGPGSFEVLDELANVRLEGFEHVFLEGNHEDFMRGFLENPGVGAPWLVNGGLATLDSYGIDMLGLGGFADGDALAEAQGRLHDALPTSHRRFLEALRPMHAEGGYVFVHAGLKPGVPVGEQRKADLLWIRGEFLRVEESFGPMVVHGHSITVRPDVRPNRIGIDTGAYQTGRLTCLVLEGTQRRFLAT